MTLVRELDSNILAQFTVPYRGTWKSTAANDVPLDAVYDSLNVFVRKGKLRSRPGFVKSDAISMSPILGGVMVVTPADKIVVVASQDKVYSLSGADHIWSQVSSTAYPLITADDRGVIDVAYLETSSLNIGIIAGNFTPLLKWTPSPSISLTPITGTNIPIAKSVCVSASRVIALIDPHTIVWSKTLDPTFFDGNAIARRAQTGDAGICVRALSALSFVLYKERSIHPARAQAGVDESTAFAFYEPIVAEGPAGIYAVTTVNGSHVYMTRNGRIGMFDGTSNPRWICDGIWLFLQDDIEPRHAYKIRAVYDYRLHTVTFFYPRKSDVSPKMQGMVIVNFPLEGLGTPLSTPYAFLGTCDNRPVTHACEVRFEDSVERSMIFAKEDGSASTTVTSYISDEEANGDDGVEFQCAFQTGLQSMPDARHTMVTVEPFIERSVDYGAVDIEPVVSDALENEGGTIPDMSAQTIALMNNPVREYKGFGQQVRFFGVRYSWGSSNTVRYSGTVLYGSGAEKYRRS